jgi:hypothetical protein
VSHEHERLNDFMREIRAALAEIKYNQNRILKGETAMALDLSALQAEVTKQTTIVASVQSFIAGLNAQLAAMQSQTVDPATASQLASLQSQLAANDTALASAIAANTTPAPAAPTP